MRTPSPRARRSSLYALSLIVLLLLGGCQAPRPIQILIPLPDEPLIYRSFEAWTHPESGVVYRVPRMFLLGLKYEHFLGENYREIMYADLADLIREQTWIQAAQETQRRAMADPGGPAPVRPGVAGDLDGE